MASLPEQTDQDRDEDRVIDAPSNVFTLVVSWRSIPNSKAQPYAPDKKQDFSYTIEDYKLFTRNGWNVKSRVVYKVFFFTLHPFRRNIEERKWIMWEA